MGDTEDCRFNTSLKYRVDIGQFRVAALWQFGGYRWNNARPAPTRRGRCQYGGGTLSLDAIGSHVQYSALGGSTLPALLPQTLTATLSDDASTMLLATAFNAGDKLFNVFWTGAKYTVIPYLDVMAAYYHYDQPTYGARVNCAAAATPATCHGTFDAISFVVDRQFAQKLDAYAGFMFSQVNGGLASSYLHRDTIDPTVGLRFRF